MSEDRDREIQELKTLLREAEVMLPVAGMYDHGPDTEELREKIKKALEGTP